MHTIQIIETDTTYFLPEKLSECTPKQLAAISYFLYLYQAERLTFKQFKSQCVYALLNMKKSKRKLSEAQIDHIDANVYKISKLLDSFFIEKNGKKYTNQDFKTNPLPYIPTTFTNLKGPRDIFYTTFGEYVLALDAFGSYQRTGKVDMLYKLASIFYRYHFFGMRFPKSEGMFKHYQSQLKKTYFGYIYAFYIYFSGFQERLANQKILYEGQEIDFSILFKSDKDAIPSTINGLGMKSHSYVLAESGVFGSLKDVNNTPTIEIILRMYDIKKRDLDTKAQLEREKKKTPA